MHTFTSDFFTHNRARLLTAIGEDNIIVVPGYGHLQRTADSTFPFVQQSSFWYLTGCSVPDLTLVISRESSYLILPLTSEVMATFDGAPDEAYLRRISGVAELYTYESGWDQLRSDVLKAQAIHTFSEPKIFNEHHGFYPNPAVSVQVQRLKSFVDETKLITDALPTALAALRSVKQPVELDAIRKAIEITGKGLSIVRDGFDAYMYEYEIEAELSKQFRLNGGSGHGFTPIVANGERAVTLHYVANNAKLESSKPTVIDVGADYMHYSADITRTILPAQSSERQLKVFEAVKRIQTAAMHRMKPGARLAELERAVMTDMGNELQQLGLVSKSTDMEAIRHYFPHATSHFLGLDVHDLGLYDEPLSENMVLTCEPGIYIPEEGFGVRIEDDILITDQGFENLSAAL